MKDKTLFYIIGAIVVIGLFMFGPLKKEAGELVNFRTTSTLYDDGGIGFSTSCGDSLTIYGHEIGPEHTSTECNNHPDFEVLIIDNIPGSAYSLGDGVWSLHQDKGDIDEVWMCMDDSDGDGSYVSRYDTDDAGDTTVSDSPNLIEPSNEVICGSSEPPCEDTSWTPSTSSVCSGDSFEQTSNCGTTRTATGTKDCSVPQSCSDLKQDALNAIVKWAVCVN